ncbi:hypothetical protein EV121DRAFT_265793, partial [Schizophyllum commune]
MFWGSRRIEAARPSVSTLQRAPSAPAFCRAYPSAGLTAAERAAALDPGVVASQIDTLACVMCVFHGLFWASKLARL